MEVANGVHVKDIDWHIVLAAHGDSGEVHYFEFLVEHLVVGDLRELGSSRIFLRVGCVDAIYACTLHHHIGLDLDSAKHGCRVGGEVWVACATSYDNYIAFCHQAQSLVGGVELAYRLHANASQHAHFLSDSLKSRAECQGVDHSGQHTHLVAFDAVETLLCTA